MKDALTSPGTETMVAAPPEMIFSTQARWATTLAYAYLLRVPLAIAIVLFFFPFFALASSFGRPVFQNFFYLEPWATVVATVGTFMVAWSVVLNALVVLFNASDRFAVPPALTQDKLRMNHKATRATIAGVSILLAAPMLTGQFVQQDVRPDAVWWNVAAVLFGGLVAYGLAFLAVSVALWLMPSSVVTVTEIFPAPAPLRRWLADRHGRPCQPAQRFLQWLASLVTRLRPDVRSDLIAGFFDNRQTLDGRPNRAYGMPWSGVLLSFAFAAVTFAVYSTIGIVNALDAADNEWSGTRIPALAYVLLLLLNAGWILSLSAYFFDRFRIPLLALLLVLALAGEFFSDSAEHYYRLSPRPVTASSGGADGSPLVSPAAVLRERVRQGKPIIVVATMGGGIQAAAWTVRVLTGLETQIHQEIGPDRLGRHSFANSIAAVSSVSGGATGSLFFLNQYRKDGAGGPGFSPSAAECATFTPQGSCSDFAGLLSEVFKPRLDDVAWALAYRDVPRIVFPYLPGTAGLFYPIPEGRFLDRGRMLELSWQRSGIRGSLSSWYEGLEEGWRPASVFNATVAETGEPFVFSTTSLKSIGADDPSDGLDPETRGGPSPWRSPRPTTFAEFYRDSDIELVTAARLASGFPYVLPIPRADRVGEATSKSNDVALKYHLIDGGYYDNYGVDSAVQWLDQGLRELKAAGERLPAKVLILQIRAFPDIRLPNVQTPPEKHDPFYTSALPRNRGWVFELFSPINGLLRVRSSGQLLHNRNALILLREKWRAPGAGGIDIRFATFEFPGTSAPLSFKMNPAQQRNILGEWSKYLGEDAPRRLHLEQIKCMFDDTLPKCREARAKPPE
jgi:hypothetical protein